MSVKPPGSKRAIFRQVCELIQGLYQGKSPCAGSRVPTQECPPGWDRSGSYMCRPQAGGVPPGFTGLGLRYRIVSEWDCCAEVKMTTLRVEQQ